MHTITYATGNSGKFRSLQRAMEGLPVNIEQRPLEVEELDSPNVVSVALAKLEDAAKVITGPLIVNDSGFYLSARPNYPANQVRRETERIGLEGFLEIVRDKDRSCEFWECLAYQDGNKPVYFAGRIPGTISLEIRGEQQEDHWSPLARIFIPEGWKKTLAEMTDDEHAQRREQLREISPEHQFRAWFESEYQAKITYDQWSDNVQACMNPYPKQ